MIRLVAPALALLLGCPEPERGPCDSELDGELRVELGVLEGGLYRPLRPDDKLMVHAGLDGGFHSDVTVRLWGEGADVIREGGIVREIDFFADGWFESQRDDLVPQCRDAGGRMLLFVNRLFYLGPDCPDDPCTGPGDDSEECLDFRDCLEDVEQGLPHVTWEEVFGHTVGLAAAVDDGESVAAASVDAIELVQGFQVGGGG